MFLVTFLMCITSSQGKNISTKDIVFKTKDNLSIYGTFYESTEGKKNLPGILLLHQFKSNRSEWDIYAKEMAANGYVILSIDLRGHGQSDTIPNLFDMLNSPDQAPLDVEEAINRLKNHPKVDQSKLAVVGGSVGGNLAAMAAGANLVKLGICISGKTSAVKNLAGNYKNFEFKNTMYVAASKDGKREYYANEMGKHSKGVNEILIDGKSEAHGVSMLKNKNIKIAIYTWLKKHL